MGVTCFIYVYYNGDFAVANYTSERGHFAGQGADIIRFLLTEQNIERLKQGLSYLDVIDALELTKSISNNLPPSLSSKTGSRLLDLIAGANANNRIPIVKDLDLANNSVLSRRAYVIDLDENRFEIFGGYEPTPESGVHRFAKVGVQDYYHVPRLLKSYDFDSLPTYEEFLSQVDEIENIKRIAEM